MVKGRRGRLGRFGLYAGSRQTRLHRRQLVMRRLKKEERQRQQALTHIKDLLRQTEQAVDFEPQPQYTTDFARPHDGSPIIASATLNGRLQHVRDITYYSDRSELTRIDLDAESMVSWTSGAAAELQDTLSTEASKLYALSHSTKARRTLALEEAVRVQTREATNRRQREKKKKELAEKVKDLATFDAISKECEIYRSALASVRCDLNDYATRSCDQVDTAYPFADQVATEMDAEETARLARGRCRERARRYQWEVNDLPLEDLLARPDDKKTAQARQNRIDQWQEALSRLADSEERDTWPSTVAGLESQVKHDTDKSLEEVRAIIDTYRASAGDSKNGNDTRSLCIVDPDDLQSDTEVLVTDQGVMEIGPLPDLSTWVRALREWPASELPGEALAERMIEVAGAIDKATDQARDSLRQAISDVVQRLIYRFPVGDDAEPQRIIDNPDPSTEATLADTMKSLLEHARTLSRWEQLQASKDEPAAQCWKQVRQSWEQAIDKSREEMRIFDSDTILTDDDRALLEERVDLARSVNDPAIWQRYSLAVLRALCKRRSTDGDSVNADVAREAQTAAEAVASLKADVERGQTVYAGRLDRLGINSIAGPTDVFDQELRARRTTLSSDNGQDTARALVGSDSLKTSSQMGSDTAQPDADASSASVRPRPSVEAVAAAEVVGPTANEGKHDGETAGGSRSGLGPERPNHEEDPESPSGTLVDSPFQIPFARCSSAAAQHPDRTPERPGENAADRSTNTESNSQLPSPPFNPPRGPRIQPRKSSRAAVWQTQPMSSPRRDHPWSRGTPCGPSTRRGLYRSQGVCASDILPRIPGQRYDPHPSSCRHRSACPLRPEDLQRAQLAEQLRLLQQTQLSQLIGQVSSLVEQLGNGHTKTLDTRSRGARGWPVSHAPGSAAIHCRPHDPLLQYHAAQTRLRGWDGWWNGSPDASQGFNPSSLVSYTLPQSTYPAIIPAPFPPRPIALGTANTTSHRPAYLTPGLGDTYSANSACGGGPVYCPQIGSGSSGHDGWHAQGPPGSYFSGLPTSSPNTAVWSSDDDPTPPSTTTMTAVAGTSPAMSDTWYGDDVADSAPASTGDDDSLSLQDTESEAEDLNALHEPSSWMGRSRRSSI